MGIQNHPIGIFDQPRPGMALCRSTHQPPVPVAIERFAAWGQAVGEKNRPWNEMKNARQYRKTIDVLNVDIRYTYIYTVYIYVYIYIQYIYIYSIFIYTVYVYTVYIGKKHMGNWWTYQITMDWRGNRTMDFLLKYCHIIQF